MAFALRPLDPFVVRSGLGSRAPTPILLRAGFALGTDGICRLARLGRCAARLTLPLATFLTLTASPATASTPPSAARLAVLASILRRLRFSWLSRFSRL
ncbi:MAG TPA: hypothetical protein VKD00_09620, partial [Methyloceanibacter sp.]|nr:hypothetical protein [Methyloceanibacter sp.]